MLKIEPRGYESKFWRYASPILALLLYVNALVPAGIAVRLLFGGRPFAFLVRA